MTKRMQSDYLNAQEEANLWQIINCMTYEELKQDKFRTLSSLAVVIKGNQRRRLKNCEASRFEKLHVFRRDNYTCNLCGHKNGLGQDRILHVDHIVPVALGGTSTLSNLQTLCQSCNLSKSCKPPL